MSRRSSRHKRRKGRRRLIKVLVVVGILALGAFAVYVFYPRQNVDDRVEAFNRIGTAFNEGKNDEARLLAGKYLKEYGESSDIRLVLGLAAIRTGRTEEGLADIRRAFEDDPGQYNAALFLADHALKRGQHMEAADLAEKALKASPKRSLPLAHYILGKIRSRTEMLDVTAAIRHLEIAAEGELVVKYRPDLYLTLSRLYAIREKADPNLSGRPASLLCLVRASEAYESMLVVEPDNERHLLGLAHCAFRLGQYGAALAHLRQVEPGTNDTGRSQLLRWMSHWKLGNDEAADDAWREFERLEPSPELLMEAANFYRSAGREDLARRVIARARKAHGDHMPLLLGEAASHMDAGRFSEAEAVLQEICAGPDAPPNAVLVLLDAISAQAGRDGEAEALLRKRCEAPGADPILHLRLAEILLDSPPDLSDWRDRLDEAQKILQPGSGTDTADRSAETYQQYLRAKLMFRRGWLSDAGGLLLDLVSRKPDEARAHLLMAQVRGEQGRPEDVVRSIDTAIHLLGASPELLLRRGQAYLDAGNAAELARRDAEQVLALDAECEPAYILLAKGFLAEDPQDEGEAVRQLLRASRLPAASGSARLLLGRLYLSKGDLEKAQEHFLRVSREARTSELRLEATSALAQVRNMGVESGVGSAARRTYESFIEQNPDQIDAQLRYANMLVENGEKVAAQKWVDEVIAKHPENVDAHILLFEICLTAASRGDLDRKGAQDVLKQVESLEPDGPEVSYLRGRLALLEDDLPTAVAELRNASQRAPRNARVAFHLGAAEFLAEDITRAKQSLEKALRLDPRNLKARVLLADVAYREGKKLVESGDEGTKEDALRKFRYALEQNPGHLGSLAHVVQSFFAAGPSASRVDTSATRRQTEVLLRRLEAIHAVQPAPALTDQLTKVHRLFGAICYVQQDWDSLIESCRRCLELVPEDPGALLRTGLALMAADKPQEAVDFVRRARDASPDSWTVLATLAELLLTAEQPDEAVTLLEDWSRERPGDARAVLLLGRVCEAAGKLDAASKSFERCLRLDVNLIEAADRLARLQAGRGKGGEAEGAIRAILPGTGRKGEMKFILGRLMVRDELTSGAGIDMLRSALREGITDPVFRVGCTVLLLRALVASERFADAIGVARRFADWHRKSGPFDVHSFAGLTAPEAFSLGGIALARTGMRDLAESFYREAVKLRPDFAQALNNLADFLGDGPPAERASALDEMLELAKRAVKLDPKEPAYLDTMGSAYLLAGKLQDAIQAFQDSLELSSKLLDENAGGSFAKALRRQIGRTWLHLAVAFFDAARLQESREALRRSTAEFPALRNEEEYLEAAAKIGL